MAAAAAAAGLLAAVAVVVVLLLVLLPLVLPLLLLGPAAQVAGQVAQSGLAWVTCTASRSMALCSCY